MADGLPRKAKIAAGGKSATFDPRTYFTAKRMEAAGMLQPGHAIMLAVTLSNTKKPQSGGKSATPKKGRRK